MEFYYNYFKERVGERYNAAPLLIKISESEKEIYEYLDAVRRGEALTKKEEPRIIKKSRKVSE